MSNKEFTSIIEGVLDQITEETDILRSKTTLDEMKKSATKLIGLLSAIRVPIQYIMLDLEATQRERDALRMVLEDRD